MNTIDNIMNNIKELIIEFGLWNTTIALAIIIISWRLPILIWVWFRGQAELEKARQKHKT